MRHHGIILAFLILIINNFCCNDILLAQQTADGDKLCNEAFEYFKNAEFNKAMDIYKKVYSNDKNNYEANYRIGYIALLSNKFEEAEKHFKKAIEIKSSERRPKIQLAEVYYRQNKYNAAASLYQELGDEGRSKQLLAFSNDIPYHFKGNSSETEINFLSLDPLPIFKIKINGKEIVVLLDTGGAQIILDKEFAKEIGLPIYGSFEGNFAGGQRNTVEYSMAKTGQFGDFIIENIPLNILPLPGLNNPGFEGERIKGIIGTQFLYQFLSTIDYTNKKLVLQKNHNEALNKLDSISGMKKVPFIMAGTH